MKYFGKYFKYRLKEAIGYFLIITLILVVIAAMFEIKVRVSRYENSDIEKVVGISSSSDYLFIAYNLIPFIVAICEFSSLMNKRNSDTAMSFPISKWGVTLAHYLVSITATVSSMVISFAVAHSRIVIKALSNGIRDYPIFNGIIWFLVAILHAIIIVTIVSFIFNCANSLLDGIVFVGAWTVSPYVIDFVYKYAFVNVMGFPKLPFNLQNYVLINTVSAVGYRIGTYNVSGTSDYPSRLVSSFANQFAVLSCAAVLSFVGFFLISRRKKVETIGDVSDSWLGYKVLIPLYGVCVALIGIATNGELISVPIVLGGMVSGYCLYRRGVRLRLPDIIWIAAITGFALIGVLI